MISDAATLEKVNPLGKICGITFVYQCLNKGYRRKSVYFLRLASI